MLNRTLHILNKLDELPAFKLIYDTPKYGWQQLELGLPVRTDRNQTGIDNNWAGQDRKLGQTAIYF